MLPRKVFCDTSFFYAGLDTKDDNHDRAKELLTEAAQSGVSFYTTWDIVSETVTLLRYRKDYATALTFLDEIKPQLMVVDYGTSVKTEAEYIFRRYGRTRRLSFCDSVSFVVVTTLLHHMPCLAFDRDFRGLGLTVIA